MRYVLLQVSGPVLIYVQPRFREALVGKFVINRQCREVLTTHHTPHPWLVNSRPGIEISPSIPCHIPLLGLITDGLKALLWWEPSSSSTCQSLGLLMEDACLTIDLTSFRTVLHLCRELGQSRDKEGRRRPLRGQLVTRRVITYDLKIHRE